MKLVFRSRPVEARESQMRMLLEFAKWLRKVSLLIHPRWQKKPREGKDYLTPKGLPANKGTSVGSGLLISYIMNLNFSWDKRLCCIQTDRINMFGDGSQAHRIHLIQNRSCNFPAQSASPLQLPSSERTAHPPLSTWSLRLDSWELSLTYLSLTPN